MDIFPRVCPLWNNLGLDMRQVVPLLLLTWVYVGAAAAGHILHQRGEVKEYCQLEMFNASCPDGQVIVVTNAHYGRMNLGRCVLRQYGSLGCTTDVLDQMDRHCSGRRQCSFTVSDLGRHPCPQDLTPYLEASFYCQRVLRGRPEGCLASAARVDMTAPTGYLSNYVTLQTGRGSPNCPWRLRAGFGQRINITLINFARAASHVAAVKSKPHVCHQFAEFHEDMVKKTLTECEGSKRIVHAYTSKTNSVDISLLTRKDSDFYFMLYYEVTGCSDPILPASLWVQRIETEAVVRCNATGDSWKLSCSDGSWHGQIGNCSSSASADWQVGMFDKANFPYSILIIVAIGVALGVFLGGILLVCVSKYLRSRTSNRHTNTSVYQTGVYGAAPGQTTGLPPDDDTPTHRLTMYQRECVKDIEARDDREIKTPLGTYGHHLPGYIPGQTVLHMYESPQFDRDAAR